MSTADTPDDTAPMQDVPASERPYVAADLAGKLVPDLVALIEKQLDLWPYTSGNNKWHKSKRPKKDVLTAVLLGDHGFTTTDPLPLASAVDGRARRPAKSTAAGKRVTTAQKETVVAQALQDGLMAESAVVTAARALNYKPAVPLATVVDAPLAPVLGLKDTDSNSVLPLPAAEPVVAQAAAKPALAVETDTAAPAAIKAIAHELADAEDPADPAVAPKLAAAEHVTNAHVLPVESAKGPTSLVTNTDPASTVTLHFDNEGLGGTFRTDTLFPFNGNPEVGDFTKNLFVGAWDGGSIGTVYSVDVYMHDQRYGNDKSHCKVQLHLAAGGNSAWSAKVEELFSAIQLSLDPIQGSAKVAMDLAGSGFLTSIGIVRDGVASGFYQSPIPIQFNAVNNSFAVELVLKGSVAIKRTLSEDPPSPKGACCSFAPRSSSNVNSKALAAASRRIAPVSIKRAKAESTEEASETAGESGDYDKVVAWVADKLKTYEGYDDFLAQRGVQGRQDSAIFKEAKWIKSFADSWNNRLAPADETKCRRSFKISKRHIEKAFEASHSWFVGKEAIAKLGVYYGRSGPEEDEEVVERLEAYSVCPQGETRLREFLKSVHKRHGEPNM